MLHNRRLDYLRCCSRRRRRTSTQHLHQFYHLLFLLFLFFFACLFVLLLNEQLDDCSNVLLTTSSLKHKYVVAIVSHTQTIRTCCNFNANCSIDSPASNCAATSASKTDASLADVDGCDGAGCRCRTGGGDGLNVIISVGTGARTIGAGTAIGC